MNKFFDKLPFKGLAEKIPAEARAKFPLLDKVIPFANQIVCGLVVVLLVACIGGGGRASSASDFSYELTADGKGIVITKYTGKGGTVVIPSKIEDILVIEIGEGAFSGSSFLGKKLEANKITSIVVPDSVEVIGDYAFNSIEKLTKVTLPNNLKVIPENAFSYCKKLTSINLPSSLNEIHSSAFWGCTELKELIIPNSLTGVKFIDNDNYAFKDCQKLPIKTRQTVQSWGYESGF
jgi:hypothetical protein